MEAQRQSVQMLERLQRDAAHGALRHLGKEKFTQLSEQRDRQTREAIRNQQSDRHSQHRLLDTHAVDDPFQHDRNADVGHFGHQQAGQGDRDSCFVLREIRQQ